MFLCLVLNVKKWIEGSGFRVKDRSCAYLKNSFTSYLIGQFWFLSFCDNSLGFIFVLFLKLFWCQTRSFSSYVFLFPNFPCHPQILIFQFIWKGSLWAILNSMQNKYYQEILFCWFAIQSLISIKILLLWILILGWWARGNLQRHHWQNGGLLQLILANVRLVPQVNVLSPNIHFDLLMKRRPLILGFGFQPKYLTK